MAKGEVGVPGVPGVVAVVGVNGVTAPAAPAANTSSGSGVAPGFGDGVEFASCADFESFFLRKYFK